MPIPTFFITPYFNETQTVSHTDRKLKSKKGTGDGPDDSMRRGGMGTTRGTSSTARAPKKGMPVLIQSLSSDSQET